MTDNSVGVETLPAHIPVFPLSGALVFPHGRLPLHIFEPRYRAMIADARQTHGLIGMVQPHTVETAATARGPRLFDVGGLGRIENYEETKDGRFLITLNGVCRFRIVRELQVETPYRQVEADYSLFAADLSTADPLSPVERAAVEAGLHSYLTSAGLSADWEAITKSDDESLINMLSAGCPFGFAEKQALLEAPDLAARADLLLQIMQFTTSPADSSNGETLQ